MDLYSLVLTDQQNLSHQLCVDIGCLQKDLPRVELLKVVVLVRQSTTVEFLISHYKLYEDHYKLYEDHSHYKLYEDHSHYKLYEDH